MAVFVVAASSLPKTVRYTSIAFSSALKQSETCTNQSVVLTQWSLFPTGCRSLCNDRSPSTELCEFAPSSLLRLPTPPGVVSFFVSVSRQRVSVSDEKPIVSLGYSHGRPCLLSHTEQAPLSTETQPRSSLVPLTPLVPTKASIPDKRARSCCADAVVLFPNGMSSKLVLLVVPALPPSLVVPTVAYLAFSARMRIFLPSGAGLCTRPVYVPQRPGEGGKMSAGA